MNIEKIDFLDQNLRYILKYNKAKQNKNSSVQSHLKDVKSFLIFIATQTQVHPCYGELRQSSIIVYLLHLFDYFLSQIETIQLQVDLHGQRQALEILRFVQHSLGVVKVALVKVNRCRDYYEVVGFGGRRYDAFVHFGQDSFSLIGMGEILS